MGKTNKLANCREAKIYSVREEKFYQAKVFLDQEGDVWLGLEKSFEMSEVTYEVTFYDQIHGVIKCDCRLKKVSRRIFNTETSVLCEILDILDICQRRNDVKVPLKMDIIIHVESEKINVLGHTRDISAGGIYFTCKTLLKVGTNIEFEIYTQNKLTSLMAKVIRFEEKLGYGYGYGCQFINISNSDEAILRNYIFQIQKSLK